MMRYGHDLDFICVGAITQGAIGCVLRPGNNKRSRKGLTPVSHLNAMSPKTFWCVWWNLLSGTKVPVLRLRVRLAEHLGSTSDNCMRYETTSRG